MSNLNGRLVLITFFVLLLTISVISLWQINIGFSTALFGGEVTNGFWLRDPIRQYHLGLWGAFICQFATALTAMALVILGKGK